MYRRISHTHASHWFTIWRQKQRTNTISIKIELWIIILTNLIWFQFFNHYVWFIELWELFFSWFYSSTFLCMPCWCSEFHPRMFKPKPDKIAHLKTWSRICQIEKLHQYIAIWWNHRFGLKIIIFKKTKIITSSTDGFFLIKRFKFSFLFKGKFFMEFQLIFAKKRLFFGEIPCWFFVQIRVFGHLLTATSREQN